MALKKSKEPTLLIHAYIACLIMVYGKVDLCWGLPEISSGMNEVRMENGDIAYDKRYIQTLEKSKHPIIYLYSSFVIEYYWVALNAWVLPVFIFGQQIQ